MMSKVSNIAPGPPYFCGPDKIFCRRPMDETSIRPHLNRAMSEAEHVVEAEGLLAVDQAVIAEQPAGRVAHQDIAAIAGQLQSVAAENLRGAPEEGAGAGDADLVPGDLPPSRPCRVSEVEDSAAQGVEAG